jgi:alkylhydroperoxidase family enzyme
MPRLLPPPDPDTIPDEEREAYERCHARAVNARADRPAEGFPPYFGALLNSPPLAAGLMDMGRVVRQLGLREGSYTHAQRELVDQVLSADWDTNVVQLTHIPDGLAVGVRLEAIDALREGREEELDDEERLLADHIRRVVSGTVTDDSYAAVEAHMGRRAALEYTIFIGFLMMTIRLNQALGVPDPSREEIDAMLDDFRSGRRELPDPSVRFR